MEPLGLWAGFRTAECGPGYCGVVGLPHLVAAVMLAAASWPVVPTAQMLEGLSGVAASAE